MAEQFNTPEVFVERYSAAVRSGFELAGRRAQALQDYWNAAAQIREPKDVVTLQAAYWRRMLDDYGAVLRETLRPPETAASAAAAKPVARAA